MIENGWRGSLVGDFGPEYAKLCRNTCSALAADCGVVRSPEWLQYKCGGHLSVEVRDASGELRGFAAFKKPDGLLVDFLVSGPSDLTPVLKSALCYLAGSDHKMPERIEEFKAMDTALIGPTLRQLHFTPVDYQFAFFCGTFNKQLAPAIRPDRWHLTPGD